MVSRTVLGYIGAAGLLVGFALAGYKTDTNKPRPIARIDMNHDGILDDFYRVPFDKYWDAIVVIDGRQSRRAGLYTPRGRLLERVPREWEVAVVESGNQVIVVDRTRLR